MEKLFDINVRITGFNQVKTDTTTVNFITFDGDCQAPFFTGKFLTVALIHKSLRKASQEP